MRAYFTSIFCNVGLVAALATGAAKAEEVSMPFGHVNLLADFVEAEDAADTVALITHGTLAHKDMELVDALQEALAERGVSSLAHTLSLGVDERRGLYDCAVDHAHKDSDADAEIAAWIGWLRAAGHEDVALIGHSRGGRQVARVAAGRRDLAGVVLMAPATADSVRRGIEGYDAAVLEKAAGTPDAVSLDVPRFLYCGQSRVRAETLTSYYSDARGAEDFAAKIKARTLVIAAGADTVVPGVAKAFFDLRSEQFTLTLVEDADHLFLDFYVEDAADVIAPFLKGEDTHEVDVDFAAADLEYGEYLGQECLACHQPGGGEGVPGIAGSDAAHLYEALAEYANGTRDHAAMRLVARSLDIEQRTAVAAHFAAQEPE